jgi:CheY-like chemotaxis protein
VVVLVPFGQHSLVPAGFRAVSKPLLSRELVAALAASPGEAELRAPRAAAPVRPLSVLLAEDNAVNATLATRLIEKAGHRVTHVWNGLEAVEASGAEPFDLIFMDLQMPELDGLEATRRIRSREQAAGGHVFVVAITANAMKSDQALCEAAGMDAHMPKPIDVRALRALLRQRAPGEGTSSAGPASRSA